MTHRSNAREVIQLQLSSPQWMLTSAPLSLRFARSCTPNTTLVPSPRLSAIFE